MIFNRAAEAIPKQVITVALFADRLGRRHQVNGGDPVNLFAAYAAAIAKIDPDLAAQCLVVVEAGVDKGVK